MRKRTRLVIGAAAIAVTAALPSLALGNGLPGTVHRVSLSDDDRQARLGEKFPERVSISAAGRYVAFVSTTPDLVPNDTNDTWDVFVRNRTTDATRRVSIGTGGRQVVDGVGHAMISANGRRVVFTTPSKLVARDTNDTVDIYVRDRWAARTMLVSQRPDGRSGNGPSYLAHLSRTGRYVAFQSSATDLTRRDPNRVEDVFLHDLRTGQTERVSVIPAGYGAQAAGTEPYVSPDGNRVLFSSLNADEGSTVWVRNRTLDKTFRVDTGIEGHAALGSVSMSAGGRYVAFMTDQPLLPADTDADNDIYRLDRRNGRRILLAVDPSGRPGNGDGETVQLSANGRFAAFSSDSSNLVPGDTNGVVDVFRRDIVAGTTRRVSVSSTGEQGNAESGYSRDVAISANGKHVAFASFASNLVPRDTNNEPDVFVWDQVEVP
jgi:Tol biopolymer transport system component